MSEPPKLTECDVAGLRAFAEMQPSIYKATDAAILKALARLDWCERRLALLAGMEDLLRDAGSASTSERDAAVVAAAMRLAECVKIAELWLDTELDAIQEWFDRFGEEAGLGDALRSLGPTLPIPDPGEAARLRAALEEVVRLDDESGGQWLGEAVTLARIARKALGGGPTP